ncbi:MAG: hypothetical protein ACRDZQ_07590, partial [Acidimicrobiales bacterium]
MPVPGPAALGRGVVVGPGEDAPGPWAGCPRYRVDEAALAEPMALVGPLHEAWLRRRPVAVELAVDPADLRAAETVAGEPYRLDPGLELARDRLQFLVWTNSYDARRNGGDPVWWHARRAVRLGAAEGGPADVVLADGRPAWCDGGPSEPLGPAELVVPGAVVVERWAIEAGSLRPAGAAGLGTRHPKGAGPA